MLLTGAAGFLMAVPALVAARQRDWQSAQDFFQSGILTLIIISMIAIATKDRPVRHRIQSQLLSLLGAFTILPMVLAVPGPDLGLGRLYGDDLGFHDHGRGLL